MPKYVEALMKASNTIKTLNIPELKTAWARLRKDDDVLKTVGDMSKTKDSDTVATYLVQRAKKMAGL